MNIGMLLTRLLMNIRKNKTIRQILKAVPFVFALYSCDPSYDMQLCPSYVVCYNNLKAISMIQDVPDINSITIQCAAVLPIQDYTLKSTGNEYKEYVRLCKKHNDESFNQYRWFPENLPQESVMYIDKDFISIDVITETEYDSEHHAGSSLSDIAGLFGNCSNLQRIYVDPNKWGETDISDSRSNLFSNCTKLVGSNADGSVNVN